MIYNYDRNTLLLSCTDDRDPDTLIIPEFLKVEWQELGEGDHGDYNPKDPLDIELLRFYISKWNEGEWEDIDSASYCTNMPTSATPEQRAAGLDYIARRVVDCVDAGISIKWICERLSWISPDWLTA